MAPPMALVAAVMAFFMAFFIAFSHPVFLHKIDGLTTGVVASTMLGPVFLVSRWHIQVNRLLVDRNRALHDDDRSSIPRS